MAQNYLQGEELPQIDAFLAAWEGFEENSEKAQKRHHFLALSENQYAS